MRISFTTSPSGLNLNSGYGLAGYGMVTSLQRCGHEVNFKDSGAPVEISFNMPDDSPWSNPLAYHISITPWESTKLKPGWLESMNSNCDEQWATSPWVAEVYKSEGVKGPISIYEHGVDHAWHAKRRRHTSGPLKFLHVGSPAPRKNAQMTMEAFRDVFGDSEDVRLTIKAWMKSEVRVYDRKHESILGLPQDMYQNVRVRYDDCSNEEMISIFHNHHALIYPSSGEGFGLIPLQSLASGMPTICTGIWAPYKRFLEPELTLSSKLVVSPWQNMHPGMLNEPSYEDLKEAFKYTADNYDKLAGTAYRNAFLVHSQYDWDTLTEKAFRHIVEKFS